jgi:ppGpp synthetase/RelA/SpoT-type nucleotidyltranferase
MGLETEVCSFPIDTPQVPQNDDEVVTYPSPSYNREEVREAGRALASGIVWPESSIGEQAESIRHVFKVAHNWREAHGLPLKRIRHRIMGRIAATGVEGFTAARVKRMASIRPKLAKQLDLDMIQDLGGCRCVLDSMDELSVLLEELLLLDCFEVDRQSAYIQKPKRSGYRSHHLIVRYKGAGEDNAYDGLWLEIQLRTKLQHTWATANEAVGLYTGQDLKGGKGSDDWLRFFALMASEIAAAEGMPVRKDAPPRDKRVAEIRHLEAKLGAGELLNACAFTFKEITDNLKPAEAPAYWLVTYKPQLKEVDVQPYGVLTGFHAYERAELAGEEAVLVDSTKLESLRREFPNYFGDVRLFQEILASVTGEEDLSKYVHKKTLVQIAKRTERPDASWLYRQGKGRWS